MQHPAQLPDLNPIENLWDEVDRWLKGQKFATGEQLFDALNQAWTNLPTNTLEKLVESMPR